MTNDMNTLKIVNPKMIHKNFSGEVNHWNPKGLRSFGILLDEKRAEHFRDLGLKLSWYTNKRLQKKLPYLKVFVNYKYYIDPIVTMVREDGGVKYLDEKTIGILDHVDMQESTLLIRLYDPKNASSDDRTSYRVAYLGVLDVNDFMEMDFTEVEVQDEDVSDEVENNEVEGQMELPLEELEAPTSEVDQYQTRVEY